jgi:hypothetical protein
MTSAVPFAGTLTSAAGGLGVIEEGAGSTTPFWAGGLMEIEGAPASDATAGADAAGNVASDEDDVPIKTFPPPGTDEAEVAEGAAFVPLEAGWADVRIEEADGAG